MAIPKKQPTPWKGTGEMEQGPDLLEATRRMDIDAIKACLARDPDSIRSVDESLNNAIQICIAGGASIRAPHILEFYLNETEIDLLHKNIFGRDSIRLAIALNDDTAAEMIWDQWNFQLDARSDRLRAATSSDEPSLKAVPSAPRGPQSGPS